MSARKRHRPRVLDRVPLDRHSVIEANAGTGKTFTLEHLVVEVLLRTDATIDQILAVTYTEKATAELRTRVRAALERALEGCFDPAVPADELVEVGAQDELRLRAALFAFERAPIHTIHSFCHRVLSDFAFQSGLRFGLELVDGRTAFHEAFRAELREHLARDLAPALLLHKWLEAEEHDAVGRLESLLYDAHRRGYLRSGSAAQSRVVIEELLASFDAGALKRELAMAPLANQARDAAFAVIEQLSKPIGSNRAVEDVSAPLCDVELDALTKHLLGTTKNAIAWSPGTRRFLDAARVAAGALSRHALAVDSWLEPIARRLWEQKRERGLLDYDDMLTWTHDALYGPNGETLAKLLRTRYRFGLIDEFQDTDEIQWSIFRRIFVEGPPANVLIAIGDPKQAIYAFRDADVFAYLRAKSDLEKHSGIPSIALTQNFRSTKSMVDAINQILRETAESRFFTSDEINYRNPSSAARYSLHLVTDGRELAPVALLQLPPGARLSARRLRAMLGRQIARTLKAIISGVQPMIIEEGAGPRPLAARDVHVLTFTNAEAVEIGGYLREQGVPIAFYKQEGLFRTSEAGDVLDLLRAIAEPERRSCRLKAWTTPFFAVPFRELARLDELDGTSPLIARLFAWRELARAERFPELFERMLHESGLSARELLLAQGQRELTNYEHVLELLLEQALTGRLSLAELIERLTKWIAGTALPQGEEGDVQRLESERAAVQIMTVHRAKGLEAHVVALFGGFFAVNDLNPVRVFHDDRRVRRFAIGKLARDRAKSALDRETKEENQRLLYVAMTRARSKLYLPLLLQGSTLRAVNGRYSALNDRLIDMTRSAGAEFDSHFEIIPVRATEAVDPAESGEKIRQWKPPPELLESSAERAVESALNRLVYGTRHRPLETRSYTSMERAAAESLAVEAVDFKEDLGSGSSELPPAGPELAGGREVGVFLHELIERLDLEALASAPNFSQWSSRAGVTRLIDSIMARHQVPDRDRWRAEAPQIVYAALRSPLLLGDTRVDSLAALNPAREVEFVFPIPSADHAWLDLAGGDGRWRIEGGVLVGYIDLVFRHAGRTYFADWKSDSLASFEPDAIAEHVARNYALQARIYTLGVARMLRLRSEDEYQRGFGGFLYVFLRGLRAGGGHGVYFARPSWSEVVQYERELMDTPRASA